MKRCFKCLETLPLSEFYRHPQMGDGHLNKCKRCTRIDVRLNRERRSEYYVEYDKQRYRLDPVDRTPKLRPYHKRRTRWLVEKAKKSGRLVPQPCEVCGATKVEAHHDDYSKPLDVRWICRKHHKMIHRIS